MLKCNNKLDGLWSNLEAAMLIVYGPAGAGKTTLCLQFLLSNVMEGGRTLFINTEDTLFMERLETMSRAWNMTLDYEKIHIINVRSFIEQYMVVSNVLSKIAKRYSLIIIDSYTNLFRLSVNDIEIGKLLKLFNIQNAHLRAIVRKFKVPVILTSQVRGDEIEHIVPTAYKILTYWSDVILKIDVGETFRSRVVEVVKHPFIKNRQKYTLHLNDKGLT